MYKYVCLYTREEKSHQSIFYFLHSYYNGQQPTKLKKFRTFTYAYAYTNKCNIRKNREENDRYTDPFYTLAQNDSATRIKIQ